MTPADLRTLAASKAAELAAWLFPDGRREKSEWLVMDGDTPSIAINLGLRAGTVRDLVSGETLHILDFYLREFGDAAALEAFLGVTPTPAAAEPLPPKPPAPEPAPHPADLERPREPQRAPEPLRMLPASDIGERGVVCSFMLSPVEVGALCRARAVLPETFHNPALGTIYRTLMDMWEKSEVIELRLVTQRLSDLMLLEQVGGPGHVAELFTYLPTATNVKNFLDMIEEKKAARDLISLNQTFEKRAREQLGPGELAKIIEEFQRDAAALTVKRRDRLPLMDSLALWEDEANLPPEPPLVLQGMLHQGSKLIIAAPSKGRKSWTLLDMAASVAGGVPWWGIPTVQGRVAYLNFEVQRFAIARRLRAISKTRRIPMTDNLQVMTLRGITTPIEQLADELIHYFMHGPPFSLIVVDPVFKLMAGRDENKVGDVMVILQNLEKIAVRTGAAIAIAHHYSKGNQAAKESIDRMGGSGAFARDPDAILMMTTHEEEECFTIEPTLRNFAPLKPFVVRWDFPVFERAPELHPDDLKQPKKPGRANSSIETAKAKLGPLFASRKILAFTEIAMQLGQSASRTSVKKWLRELGDAGLVDQIKIPKKGYQATDRWEGLG